MKQKSTFPTKGYKKSFSRESIPKQDSDDEMRYADDIGIYNWDKNDIEPKINIPYQGFQEVGPKRNHSKHGFDDEGSYADGIGIHSMILNQ